MNKDFIPIINAALDGDETAFEVLYNMTYKSAYFVALNITGNEQDALDILQDSYIKAFTRLDTLNPPELFDNWLSRIVANNSVNLIKRKKPVLFEDVFDKTQLEQIENESESNFAPHEIVDKKETSRLIMNIINSLSEDRRIVILMYYYQDLTVKEIAETLGLTESNVKYRLYMARKDIKSELEKLDREGTRLYAALPFSVFSQIFADAVQNTNAPEFSAISHSVLKASAVSTTGAVHADTASAAAITKSGGLTMLFKSTMSKIIAAVVAAAVVGGGVTAAVIISNSNKGTVSSPAGNNIEPDEGIEYLEPPDDEHTEAEISTEPEISSSPISDFSYQIEDDGVVITRYYGSDPNVVIPKTIEGKPVKAIKNKHSYGTMVTGAFENNIKLESVIIPSTVTEIGDSAFAFCDLLKEINIPDGVTRIGDNSFSECVSLKSISLPESVNEIGQGAFLQCSALESIDAGKNITKIGKAAFASCSSLKNIELSEGLKEIGNETFYNCYALESIKIPKSVTNIGDRAFYECRALKEIILPQGLESIGSNAFICHKIKSMYIPESVTSIGKTAFTGSNSIMRDDPFVIMGKEGSYAEEYASQYVNIEFESADEPAS